MTADEKSCPYCAETIKAAAVKCRFCGSHLTEATDDSKSSPANPTIAACEKCNVALIQTTQKATISAAGIFGALFFIVGLFAMLFSVVTGIVIIVVALLVSVFGRSSTTTMVCPQCGMKGVEF